MSTTDNGKLDYARFIGDLEQKQTNTGPQWKLVSMISQTPTRNSIRLNGLTGVTRNTDLKPFKTSDDIMEKPEPQLDTKDTEIN